MKLLKLRENVNLAKGVKITKLKSVNFEVVF